MLKGAMRDAQLEIFIKQEEALEAQLKALRAAKKAYIHQIADIAPTLKKAQFSRTTTIKDEIIEILHDKPKGMTALEILAEIKQSYRPNLQRETLSPQLSRLKQAGKLISYNKIWRIARWNSKEYKKNGHPKQSLGHPKSWPIFYQALDRLSVLEIG